jgi:L-amino acid N-acyltransferase YncA
MSDLEVSKFKNVDLSDPFFDSLKDDYSEFPKWFSKKAENTAYVHRDKKGKIQGFLYLKTEMGKVTDVAPPLRSANWIKVGTFKINPHGTKLGERFLKRIFDFALQNKAEGIYVTVFSKHGALIDLFKQYGFVEHSKKTTANGTEEVLVRDFDKPVGDMIKDYPFVRSKGVTKALLAIYPDYHTDLLPDSMLNNESAEAIQDVSHTNTIRKIYVCSMNVGKLRRGDILVMYRTTDGKGKAWYRSVASSLCVVEEVKSRKDFGTSAAFAKYCRPHSVFSIPDLEAKFNSGKRLYAIKMTYNAAFPKRTTRGNIIEHAGVSDVQRWDFLRVTDSQFEEILELGHVDEDLIID